MPVLVSQLEVNCKVDWLLTGQSAQQSVATAQWESNKTTLWTNRHAMQCQLRIVYWHTKITAHHRYFEKINFESRYSESIYFEFFYFKANLFQLNIFRIQDI